MAPPRRRLDRELVRRGLAPSRERARALIEAGQVTVGGAAAAKPARLVGADEAIELLGPAPRFVGRGGDKLAAALDHFSVDVGGTMCADVGASTGGFTDCLLQHGAAGVEAIDVGYGQLHERLRADPRVRVRERTNVRDLRAGDLDPPPAVVVADLSFISLRTVLPALLPLVAPGADLVLLVKPQFEAGRAEASRGKGVIDDPAVWRRALAGVVDTLHVLGAAIMGVMVSPLRGADGNVEFLLHASAPGPSTAGRRDVAVDLDAVVERATGGAR